MRLAARPPRYSLAAKQNEETSVDQAAAQTGGDKRLSLGAIMTFAGANLQLGALSIAISVYLPPFFARHIGISLAAVAGAFGIVRMIDIFVDVALGLAMDRTRTPLGRYRLWAMIGVPVLVSAVAMLFFAPPGISSAYLIGWLLAMYLGTSILSLSHVAWAVSLAPSYHERSRIFGVITAVGVLGALLVLAMPAVTKALGHTGAAAGVQAMGWMLITVTPVTVAIMVLRTPEKLTNNVHTAQFKLRDYWDLICRPTMSRLMIADLCLALGPGWMAALYLFFFTDSRGFTTEQASLLLGIYTLAGFFGAPLIGRLGMKISKHRAVQVATTGYSLVLMCIPFIPKGSMVMAIGPMFLAGFLAAGFNVMTRSMTADISDEVRLEQGKERAGLIYALTTLTTKIASACSILLTYSVLSRIGYNAKEGAVNTPAAIFGLELAYIIGPIVFVMIGGACFIGYKLSAERHADIRRQLAVRDALYEQAPIIDSLSGDASIPSTLVEPQGS
jgi:Na+/melibiose symporter-like transporter